MMPITQGERGIFDTFMLQSNVFFCRNASVGRQKVQKNGEDTLKIAYLYTAISKIIDFLATTLSKDTHF